MSASLVGSEMCIRDSKRAKLVPASAVASTRDSPRCLRLFSGPASRADGPVSYTHLTLPTICSV
eukprot:12315592-Alexandrium_andersonii.AAC.1